MKGREMMIRGQKYETSLLVLGTILHEIRREKHFIMSRCMIGKEFFDQITYISSVFLSFLGVYLKYNIQISVNVLEGDTFFRSLKWVATAAAAVLFQGSEAVSRQVTKITDPDNVYTRRFE